MWLAAVYAYLYSDIVVRKIGVYLALAGFSLVMAEVTLLFGFDVDAEWIIATMALTSVAINLGASRWDSQFKNLQRMVAPPLAFAPRRHSRHLGRRPPRPRHQRRGRRPRLRLHAQTSRRLRRRHADHRHRQPGERLPNAEPGDGESAGYFFLAPPR